MQDRLFRDILPRVSKPIRYTGNELNVIKKNWESSRVKMVFAFPDVYEVGMSHIGGRILYGLINETTDHLLERSFAPWPDMEKLMREEGIPLYALESYRPLADFEVVGFSLQYELSATNILNMLDLAGIPVFSRERTDEDPLVLAGGPVAFNPEPFCDFFDMFMIGDGEEALPELLDEVERVRKLPRQEKLRQLAKVEGIYVPSLYKVAYDDDGSLASMEPLYPDVPRRVRKRIVANLDEAYYPDNPIHSQWTRCGAILHTNFQAYMGHIELTQFSQDFLLQNCSRFRAQLGQMSRSFMVLFLYQLDFLF